MTYSLRRIDDVLVEVCDECGFDSRAVPDPGEALTAAYRALGDATKHPRAEERPAAETWSAKEYAEHVIKGANATTWFVTNQLGRPAPDLESDLEGCTRAAAECRASLAEEDLPKPCTYAGLPTTLEAVLLHHLHDVEHHVLDVRRGLAGLALATGTSVVTIER